MALPFLAKKEEGSSGKGYAPVDRVKELASRGFSETEIIDVLRKEGFSPDEIDRALTDALKLGVSGISPPSEGVPELPSLEEIVPKPSAPEIPETSLPETQPQYLPEEYIDLIVRERTNELAQKLNEFMIKYNEVERRLQELRAQLNEMIKGKSSGEKLILTKLETIGETLEDVEVRLSSLEKAFKEALPALIESVKALTDLVQRIKREV